MFTLFLSVFLLLIIVAGAAMFDDDDNELIVDPASCTIFTATDEAFTAIDLELLAIVEEHLIEETVETREYYDELADIDWEDDVIPLDDYDRF
jgi:hypothetical protein